MPKSVRNTGLLLPIAVFLVSLAIFWWCAAPGISFHDSGEFALAASCAGIPHPPGAPTWSLLASLWVRLLPESDPARMTNLFSGLWGAGTLALVSATAYQWTLRLFPGRQRAVGWAAGISAPAILLYSGAFLEQATITEQYTLQTALQAAVLLVASLAALPATEKTTANPRRQTRFLLLLGLLSGLAIGNHPSQIILIPFALWAAAAACSYPVRRIALLRAGGAVLVGLCLGLLVFLYLPLRSHAHPILDDGNIKTLDRFVWAILREQWQTRPLSQAPPGFAREWLGTYDFLGELTPVGVGLCLLGLATLALRRRFLWLSWALAIPVVYGAGMLFAHLRQQGIDLNYLRQYGVIDWHLPLYGAAATAAGIGAGALAEAITTRFTARTGSVIAFSLIVVFALGSVRAALSHSLHDWNAPERYRDALLAPLPADAAIVVTSDNPAHMLTYTLYGSKRTAPTARWMCFGVVPAAGYVDRVAREKGAWSDEAKATYLHALAVRHDLQPLTLAPLPPERIQNVRLFCDYDRNYPAAARWMKPAGLLMEVCDHPVTDAEVRAADAEARSRWPDMFAPATPGMHRLDREAWGLLHQDRGTYFLHRGMWREALDAFDLSITFLPRNGWVWYSAGKCAEALGDRSGAEAKYRRALSLDSGLSACGNDLAVLLARQGRMAEAETLLSEVLERDPQNAAAAANLRLVRSHH